MVNEYCTCGAHLPPDARFCHKCGKPQYELPVVEPALPADPPADAALRLLPGVGWRNPTAVRVASIAGAIISLLLLIPLPPIINVLWMFLVLIAGGFWSVHLYRKRTTTEVSVRS